MIHGIRCNFDSGILPERSEGQSPARNYGIAGCAPRKLAETHHYLKVLKFRVCHDALVMVLWKFLNFIIFIKFSQIVDSRIAGQLALKFGMRFPDLAKIRLHSQQIARPALETPGKLVGFMGAMQAQDFAMAKWACGLRVPGAGAATIETALEKGEILRTHLLRSTWHFVAAEDIYWLLELTAPQIRTALRYRHKTLEMTPSLVNKSNRIIEKTLADAHLTRDEIARELERGKIATRGDNRLAHLLLCAELEGVICSGAARGSRQTYALLPERVPHKKKDLPRDEALARLAQRYFTSHGPASLPDFRWWSGLSVKDARAAVKMAQADLIAETVDQETYWLSNKCAVSKPRQAAAIAILPAFDEFIVAYKDRTPSLPSAHYKKAITNNGLFRPVVVQDGAVIGLWKPNSQQSQVAIEIEYFNAPAPATCRQVTRAAAAYAAFVGLPLEVAHIPPGTPPQSP
jgi:hypothetical protein